MPAKICRPSGTCAMPRRSRSAGGSASIGAPSRRIVPLSGRSSPETAFASVDFPAPLAPSKVTISPRSSVRSISSSTRWWPYPTATDLSSRSGMMLLSEIGFDHAAVALDLRRSAGGDNRAGIDHDDAVGDIHHQRHVVLHDQHGNAEGPDRAHQIRQFMRLGVIEPGCRLVE